MYTLDLKKKAPLTGIILKKIHWLCRWKLSLLVSKIKLNDVNIHAFDGKHVDKFIFEIKSARFMLNSLSK